MSFTHLRTQAYAAVPPAERRLLDRSDRPAEVADDTADDGRVTDKQQRSAQLILIRERQESGANGGHQSRCGEEQQIASGSILWRRTVDLRHRVTDRVRIDSRTAAGLGPALNPGDRMVPSAASESRSRVTLAGSTRSGWVLDKEGEAEPYDTRRVQHRFRAQSKGVGGQVQGRWLDP